MLDLRPLLLALVLSSVLSPATVLEAQEGTPVPMRPPDSLPPDLYHDSLMVADTRGLRWSRAVIAIHFSATASQADRQSAVDLVKGVVVGGIALAEDGYYLVRVPHGATLVGVDSALATLRRVPAVKSALRIAAPLQPAVQPHPHSRQREQLRNEEAPRETEAGQRTSRPWPGSSPWPEARTRGPLPGPVSTRSSLS